MTWFIRIIPMTAFVELVLNGNGTIVAKAAAGNHKSCRACEPPATPLRRGRVGGMVTFVICSRQLERKRRMTRVSTKTLLAAAVLSALATAALAQAAGPTP